MGTLDGDIRELFASAFGDLYHDGELHDGTESPVYDDDGNIVDYSDAGAEAIKCQVDEATYAMRRADGYAEGDVMLIILADGIGRVTTDAEVSVDRGIDELGGTEHFRIMSAELDAAASHWICRARGTDSTTSGA